MEEIAHCDEIVAQISHAALNTGPVIVPVPLAGGVGGFLPLDASLHGVTSFGNVMPAISPRSPFGRN
mgnify:CR=1 FL=1